MSELIHSIRRVVRTPGFSLASVGTIVLGIGSSLVVFTLVERIVLAPLPYPQAGRLFFVDDAAPGVGAAAGYGVSQGIVALYSRLPGVDGIARYQDGLDVTLSRPAEPERLVSMRVTPSVAPLFGIRLDAGRWVRAEDSTPDAPRVAALAGRLARRLFGTTGEDAIGRTVSLDNVTYQVIGVTDPLSPAPADDASVFLPYPYLSPDRIGPYGSACVVLLHPGEAPSELRDAMTSALTTLAAAFPADLSATAAAQKLHLAPIVEPLKEHTLGNVTAFLWVLLIVAAAVLLLGISNLSNLWLMRAEARRAEWALRQALGANSRQARLGFALESTALSFAAGLLAIPFSKAVLRWCLSTAPFHLPRAGEVVLDWIGISLALLAALTCGLALGGWPMFVRSANSADGLRQFLRSSGATGRATWRRGLVAAQMAFSMLLVITAGLLCRSFLERVSTPHGFRAASQLTFRLDVSRNDLSGAVRKTAAVHQDFLDALSATPRVQAAAVMTTLPLHGVGPQATLEVQGRETDTADSAPRAAVRGVSVGAFQLLGIPVTSGRRFTVDDLKRGDVAVINRALAAQLFPGGAAIGQHLRWYRSAVPWFTIIGVVGDTPTTSVGENPVPQLFVSLPAATLFTGGTSSYLVSTRGSIDANTIRGLRDTFASGSVLSELEPLSSALARANAGPAQLAELVGLAAMGALLLGTIGVYSVVAYSVALRQHELQTRLILGADPFSVAMMVVRQNLRPVAWGVSVGALLAFYACKSFSSQLYLVTSYDPATYVVATAILAGTAILVSWWPAFRTATRVPLRST